MKILLYVMLLIPSVCHASGVDELFSFSIDFSEHKFLLNSDENFEASLRPVFQPKLEPEHDNFFECGLIVEKQSLPDKLYSIQFLGHKETMIPLLGRVRRDSIWLYSL